MTEEQARRILENLEVHTTKTRSILMETNGVEDQNNPNDVGMMVLIDLFPWIFEPKRAFLLPLSHLNERTRKTGHLEAGDFMNFMHIASDILPLTATFAPKWGYELPEWSPDIMRNWGKHEPQYDPRKERVEEDESDLESARQKVLDVIDAIESPDYMHILDEVISGVYEYEMDAKARIITPPLDIPTPAMKIDDIAVDYIATEVVTPEDRERARSEKEKHPTQSGHTSIYDFPHLEESVRMLVFVDGHYPVNFMFGGTTVFQGEQRIATASPWIDGSMFVHTLASSHVYLVSVVDVLNAVFKLEGIDIDAAKINGKWDTGLRSETQSVRDFEPEIVKATDIYGTEIEVGDRVSAMIGITNAMAFGDDADDSMLVRRGWYGTVASLVSDRAIEVKFDRMDGDTVEILSEYVGVLGEDDEV